MTLDELKAEMEVDVKIDKTNLDSASLNVAFITSKYLNYRADENIIVHIMNKKHKKLYKDKWEHFTGKSAAPSPLRLLKTDLHIYLDADEELSELAGKIAIRKEKVKLLDGFIQILNSRSFNISNAIKWQIFTTGGEGA